MAQYDHFQDHTLAVRGDRLCLFWSRWSDDTGNQATHLHVVELGDDGLIASLLYFDEDDFRAAYRELEARYYAGEGAAYANHGHTQSAFVEAMNQLDVAAARQQCRPEFRWMSPPKTLVAPVRTVDDVVTWWRERAEQVESLRNWNSALTWLSPKVLLATGEARGVTSDGAEYSWSGIYRRYLPRRAARIGVRIRTRGRGCRVRIRRIACRAAIKPTAGGQPRHRSGGWRFRSIARAGRQSHGRVLCGAPDVRRPALVARGPDGQQD